MPEEDLIVSEIDKMYDGMEYIEKGVFLHERVYTYF
ncbi:hypothetical protein SAMN05443246_2009 [Paenibacillus sp. GP183]|nr:hypothetical protein SAMN05443246_2009 [Paenibacillus sp. GP183]